MSIVDERGAARSAAFEIAAEKAEFAQATRDEIDARLSLRPDAGLRDEWTLIARVSTRGIEETAIALIDAIVGPEPNA